MERRLRFIMESFALLTLITIAFFLRTYDFPSTGVEVDEVSNYYVALSVYNTGTPLTKGEIGQSPQQYFFNPPLGFELMSSWFIVTGCNELNCTRLFNILISLAVLLLVYLSVRDLVGLGTALLALFFLSLDGWVIMINRMNYLENTQLLFIVLGVWFWGKAHRLPDSHFICWNLSGLFLGLAVIFKHIGVFVLLAVFLAYLLYRRKHLNYLLLLLTMSEVVLVYSSVMLAWYGLIYFEQQYIQLLRLFGVAGSLGMNFSIWSAFSIIADRYWIYITTVLVLLIGWPFVSWKYTKALTSKMKDDPVFLSWAFSGFIFAALSRLKSPHYLILWLFPLYIFIALELVKWAKGKRLLIVPAIMAIFTVMSVFTWHYRFIDVTGDPVRQAATYIQQILPPDSVIGTENYIGFLFPQNYRSIDQIGTASDLSDVDYLAIYQSSTYQVTDLPLPIQWAYIHCHPLATFKGFKDSVIICPVAERRLP